MTKNKKALFFILVALLALGVFLVFYSSVIFQEGNPWPQIKGIVRLNFGQEDVVKLDIGENKYITKNDNPEIIKSFMKDRGYDFTEQMGSGYLFKSNTGTSAVAVHRYYSRYYSLWSITENGDDFEASNEPWTATTTQEESLSDQIKQCLIMSDMASKEKCEELLGQIVNFDSCVMAGLSIMKSNPPQCATPDGRIFIQETNSTWEQALLAVNNCAVEKVFQMHSRIVTLALKNGNKLIAAEPKIDDIIAIVKAAESKCGEIPIATE
jgi:hypothetical protein